MATQEKLLKSLESLRQIINSNLTLEPSRKKEKILHCNTITDAISNPTIRVASNFGNLLSFSIEVLLQLCNDPESDVRLVADECLNRLITATIDGNVSKIQIELHKKIKENGEAKSLRAALWRFAKLAHFIRPHKGKPYVANFLPCIIKVIERQEELLHETLGNSIPKIMAALGNFMTDSDIKVLLKAFLSNVSSTSPVLRRTTANCLLTICLNSKNSNYFLIYMFNSLLDMLLPTEENHSSALIIGVMGCLKLIIPHLETVEHSSEMKGSFGVRKESTEMNIATEKFLQLYELCLYYLNSSDHNIINADLETLNSFLLHCPQNVKEALLSQNGLNKSLIFSDSYSKLKLKSPSALSVTTMTLSGEDMMPSESELLDSVRPDIEKWIDESKLSVMNVTFAETSKMAKKELSNDEVDYEFPNIDKQSEYGSSSTGTDFTEIVKNDSIVDNLDKLILNDKLSEKSYSLPDSKSIDLNFSSQDVDIGSFKDNDVPLLYSTRLIAKSFLLMGKQGCLIPDKNMRVSVKSLALTCLSSIANLYPEVFLRYLDKNQTKVLPKKNTPNSNGGQQISDILLYSMHSDPQLRGATRMFVANFIKMVILNSGNNYEEWISNNSFVDDESVYEIKNLVNILLKGLEDESSTCTRQTVISLGVVLSDLLKSQNNQQVLTLLNALPFVAINPYWLVKVKVLELLSDLCYTTVHHIFEGIHFQSKILYSVLFEMLKDDDPRVRTACSEAIVKIIPMLYFPQDNCSVSAITYKAKQIRNLQLSEMIGIETDINPIKKRFINELIFPFNNIGLVASGDIDCCLSRVVSGLKERILTSKSKFFIHGCVETLCKLSDAYPPTVYSNAWSCFTSYCIEKEKTSIDMQSSADLFKLCVNLAVNNSLIYDISCHINLLKLLGNVFAGVALANLRPKVDFSLETGVALWDMFEDKGLCFIAEQFLCHIVRLLNIFCHVVEDMVPVLPQSRNMLSNLPSSPIKKRKGDTMEMVKILTTIKGNEKEDKGEKKNEPRPNSIGCFSHLPHYMKIYEILKTAYTNYKTTLDFENPGKFIDLLQTNLIVLSQVFEIGTLYESGRIIEELLSFLQTMFPLAPSHTVECVQQLLKSLFGANLTSTISDLGDFTSSEESIDPTFYYNIFQKPYSSMSAYLKSLSSVEKIKKNGDNTVMGYLHRKDSLKTPIPRGSEKVLASYIRLFEPMVIKSLKQYTITSDVLLQCKVLKLLCQLVQLRVNYCLLDSEQVFIGFVIKQFEFIEEGQIILPGELIPRIFDFLVHLSYGKQHSKSIIGIPKIIQLCDGLMASGQPPLVHCVPALRPVVEDIFLLRNKSNASDYKEMETTREVLFSMLLRLLEYSQVIDLLVLVLNESRYCNDNSEKWLRWSRQTVDALLPMLKMNKIRINDKGALISLKQLIMVLNPAAFKPINNLLVILFENPPAGENNLTIINHWFGKVITILLMVSHIKEDVLLSEIKEVQEEFSPQSVFRSISVTSDPLNVTNTTEVFSGILPEIIFVRFLFRTVEIISSKCTEIAKNGKEDYLIQQFSDYLMFCLHILQSGSHCKITNTATNLFNAELEMEVDQTDEKLPVDEINSNFLYLSSFFPNLTFYWCCLLTLLNYNNRKFWAKILQITESYGIIEQLKSCTPQDSRCINLNIVRIGGTITFCDYLSENMLDGEQLSWFLVNSIELLVHLSDEPPVFEFLTSLHRNPSASSLVIHAVSAKCLNKMEPDFKMKILKCVENAHTSQIGAVLKLLLPKLLDSKQLAISRLVANVASRKVELLLTMSMEEVNAQLPREDLDHIMDLLVKTKLAKKHEALVGLLNKLATHFYDLSPLEFVQRRMVNPEYIKKLQVNKNWYLTQIKSNCYNLNMCTETAELLDHLEYDDLMSMMSKKDFNKIVLKDCIKLSIIKIRQESLSEEPPLLKAAVTNIIDNVKHIRSLVPKPHQVYKVLDRDPTPSEMRYSTKLTEIFSDEFVWSFLYDTIPSVTCYIESLSLFPTIKIPDSYFEDFIKFAVICLESVNFILDVHKCNIKIKYIVDALKCADVICKEIHLCGILGLDTHVSWLCSAVNSIYKFVGHLLSDKSFLPIVTKTSLKGALENPETVSAGHCCYQLSVLIVWLEKLLSTANFPKYFLVSIKSLVTSLARLPLVNSYILTPPSAWKNGFAVELSGIFSTQVPPLPIDFLKEVEILEEFVFRITLLGWTSRQQFEETWMCLLSVLNSVPNEDNITTEASEVLYSICIAVKAITSLLLQTLYMPVIGNPNISKLLHVPRDQPLNAADASIGKLKDIQNKFLNQFNEYTSCHHINGKLINVFTMSNLEKTDESYTYGQLSVEYLVISSKIAEINNSNNYVAQVHSNRQKILEESGLDLNSCLQFLLDLYSQWLSSETTAVRLLHEVVQSVIIISDLFTDKSQYDWMLESFLNLSKSHTTEDEIMHQYIVIGCCKAAAVLIPDMETYENLKKLIEQNLKSAFIPCRIAALHGILYIMQGNILGNTHIGELSEEMQVILPVAINYVQCNIQVKNDVLSQSLEHTLTVWALAFYLVENIDENNLESQFITTLLQGASLILQSKGSRSLQVAILKGLERLVIKKCLSNKYNEYVMKLAVETVKNGHPSITLSAIQVLLSCIYTSYTGSLQIKSSGLEENPDNLVQLIEKISLIFDHIKKGYPFEVQILCSILPDMLNSFFTPADILTKVLGEFLSQQQPHPKLLSSVVFKVFENAINQSQLPLLQDWVVFSLSNFTNSFSIGMATWYLTCFFVSASTNPWLRSLFPYVQARIGRYEYEDKKMLCVAGADFYKNLTNDKQRQTFIDSFEKVKDQIDAPFSDLLASVWLLCL